MQIDFRFVDKRAFSLFIFPPYLWYNWVVRKAVFDYFNRSPYTYDLWSCYGVTVWSLYSGGGGVLYSSEFVRPFSNHLLMAMAPFKYKSWMFEKILDVCPEMLWKYVSTGCHDSFIRHYLLFLSVVITLVFNLLF